MAKFKGASLICAECGAGFKVPPTRALSARYCSKECADKHRNDGRERQVTLACRHCGGEFQSVECHAGRRIYCSRKCKETDAEYLRALSLRNKGAGNAAWVGGRSRHSEGYWLVLAPDHPFASNGYILEHRLVMEVWLRECDPNSKWLISLGLQKYLTSDCVVHHRDEDKTNNQIENLECMTRAEHRVHHSA